MILSNVASPLVGNATICESPLFLHKLVSMRQFISPRIHIPG